MLDRDSVHSNVLESLLNTLRDYDDKIDGHIERISRYCELIAPRFSLSDKQISDLMLLCKLHDIGKVCIPIEILNKVGKLTREEWASIQAHTEKGFQIAKSSKELADIAVLIKYHHERFDGNGYPEGISRESIPFLSRILSVVDAYDSMLSARPYRNALPPEYAMNELRSGAGSQFDPVVGSEFLQVLGE